MQIVKENLCFIGTKFPHLGTTVNLLYGFDSWLVPRTMFTSRCLFDLTKASIMLANSV